VFKASAAASERPGLIRASVHTRRQGAAADTVFFFLGSAQRPANFHRLGAAVVARVG